MGRQKVTLDKTVRYGDTTADVSADGTVTITVGDGDDHQHLEISPEQAVRLCDVLAGVTEWGDD